MNLILYIIIIRKINAAKIPPQYGQHIAQLG